MDIVTVLLTECKIHFPNSMESILVTLINCSISQTNKRKTSPVIHDILKIKQTKCENPTKIIIRRLIRTTNQTDDFLLIHPTSARS